VKSTRSRLIALVAGAALLAGIGLVLAFVVFGSSDEPPPGSPAALVPANAFAYVSVSTDDERDATKRGSELIGRLGLVRRIRDQVITRLAGRQIDTADLEPFLGDVAAVAIAPNRDRFPAIMIILEVADVPKAKTFLNRQARVTTVQPYHGVEITSYGPLAAAFLDGQLVLGPLEMVQAGVDAGRGRRPSLASTDAFRDARAGLPAGRVLEAYVTAAGSRQLLAPAGGILGFAGTLLTRPALVAAAAGAEATDDGVKLVVHSLLDPQIERRRRSPFKPFRPTLQDRAPASTVAFIGLAGVDESVVRLLGTLGGADGPLANIEQAFGSGPRGRLAANSALQLLEGEVALLLTQGPRRPVISLLAQAPDADAAMRIMRTLERPLANVIAPGATPQVGVRKVEGTNVRTLTMSGGRELAYAVDDGVLIVSSSPVGVETILRSDESLADTEDFERTTEDRPDRISSLLFLDLSQLLELGERGGLGRNPTYRALRGDLNAVQAVGAFSSGNEEESSAEVSVLIP
jgi:hypothetical protein